MKKTVILLFIFTFIIALTLSSFKVSASSYNVNLASPDLTDKEHLGNGVYRLYDNNGVLLDYNIYSGIYTINGTNTSRFSYIFTDYIPQGQYTLSYNYVSGSFDGGDLYISNTGQWNIDLYIYASNYNQFKQNSNTQTIQTRLYFDFVTLYTFNQYKFKLQFEKGLTATPYQIPMGSISQHNELISGDLPNNFFQVLYDLMKDFIRSIAFVWIWLNAPIKIGFELPIVGYIGIPPFTPLSAFGIGILVVIGLWAVKSLVPMG